MSVKESLSQIETHSRFDLIVKTLTDRELELTTWKQTNRLVYLPAYTAKIIIAIKHATENITNIVGI